ncbi:tetratricopeptide repeat protein [Streptomyces sp. NPDC001617]
MRHGTDQTASDMLDVEPALAPAEPGRPETLLLVVDYAERWPHQQLVDFLDDCREQGHRRVRVLLISRSVGGWWSTPTRYLTDWGIPFGDVRLPPLEEDEGIDRGMLYTRACAYFASAVDATMPDEPRDLTGDGFFTVLAVHMAALADVEAQRRGEAPPSSRAGISEYLVKREREQWERLLQSGRVAIGPDVFAQVVYTAALTGALPRNDAVAAVARVEVDCHETPAKVVKDHAVAYPVHQSGTVLEPLHPDLLAEDFLALLLPAEPAFSPLGDDWAVDAPRRLILGEALTVEEEQVVSAAWTKRALITLIEAARRWEHVTRRQLVPLLADHPELFRQAGSAAISRLADNLCIPESLLDALETALPFMDVELDAGAAALAERLTDYRLREAGADVYKRALVHRQLAHRLDHAGEYVKAAAEIQKDLEIFRELKDRDEHHLARFAVDLDWAGVIFTRSGDHVRGLEATREAIGIETELVERVGRANPELADEYRRMLTYSLGNLAGRPGLSAEERRDEAREGARLSRQLIGEGDPAQDGIELAGCLHNLGCALIDLGEFDEALEHLHSAVAIRRSQTHRHFGYYAPLLEIVLFDLRDCHAAMGSLDAALTIAEEHVRLLRTLAEASEGRFDDRLEAAERRLRDLARSAD